MESPYSDPLLHLLFQWPCFSSVYHWGILLCCLQLILPSPVYISEQNDTITKDPYVAMGICALDLARSRTVADLW